MKKLPLMTIFAVVFAVIGFSHCSGQTASAGRTDCNLVSVKDGTGYAELPANTDTGEVLVNTWTRI